MINLQAIVRLARECREAQKKYYRSRVGPDSKQPLLIIARQAENALDDALANVENDEEEEVQA